MRRTLAWLFLLLTLNAAQAQTAVRAADLPAFTEPVPVLVQRARQYDFISNLNGEAYRIMVATPAGMESGKTYPVVYVFDGNAHFTTVADTAYRLTVNGHVAPAIVVGIGYPLTDLRAVERRRLADMTLSPEAAIRGALGHGDVFLRVLAEEIKPFVQAHYQVDLARQSLFGYSLGGLMALRVLFRHPEAFSTYVIISPSIWWKGSEVLADEAAFGQKLAALPGKLQVLLTSGGDEQYRGDDPARLARDKPFAMVDNASALATRLALLPADKLAVKRLIFENENHTSTSAPAYMRGLWFALPPQP